MMQVTEQSITLDLSEIAESPVLQSSTACVSDSGCVEHLLYADDGVTWTMVGAPFMQSVAVGDLRLQTSEGSCSLGCNMAEAIEAELTNGVFYSYDPQLNRYLQLEQGGSLLPGVGYWFANTLPAGDTGAKLLIPAPSGTSLNIFEKAELLGRGINLGNALEAPEEGLWGIFLEDYYFDRIADAGFDSVRIPIRWSAHALESAPYTIDPAFFERIDWVLEQSERVGLASVINIHHYEALMASPQSERERFIALWDQIANRYSDAPDSVFFEVLNEPTEKFTEQPTLWNDYLAEAVQQIRLSNPTRALIAGPVGWNAIEWLPALSLPTDSQLITTVHYYSPFEFTHQGAEWITPTPPVGVSFDADALRLSAAYQDWSWDTTVQLESDAITVNYARQYAGFNLRTLTTDAPVTLNLVVSGPADLNVGCGQGGNFNFVGEVSNTAGTQNFSIDLTPCGNGIETVVMQNQFAGAVSVNLVSGEICDLSACQAFTESAGQAIATDLQQAALFGDQNGTPIYVGEFGAYNPGDMESRADWTATVQNSLQALGMTSSYWEFGAGFGAFDLGNDQWREPLLNALLP